MDKEIIISPSILSARKDKLGEDVNLAKKAGAKWLHYDIMDGHFVPNLTFGPDFVSALKGYGLFNDVHLMIDDPVKYAGKFINSGADLITFHYEAVEDVIRTQEEIRSISGSVKVGLSIKPRTEVKEILPFINYFDLILVMSVEPGFSGQKFIPNSIDKIKQISDFIDKNRLNCLIEVDGGINQDTYSEIIKAGADVLVTGSFFFSSKDKKATVDLLKGIK